MKKRVFLALTLTGVLAMAAIGGTVLAQTAEDEEGGDSFAERVAIILGLETEVVEDAMQQAQRELHDERIQAHLDALVESGRLTQEEADEYLKWLMARPEGIGQGMFGFGPKDHGHMFLIPGALGPRAMELRVSPEWRSRIQPFTPAPEEAPMASGVSL